MPLIPARVPFTPPELGREYNRSQLRTLLGDLARSVSPMTTRTVVFASPAGDKIAKVTDDLLVCDTAGGGISITLPVPDQVQFLKLAIINIGAGTVTIVGTVSGAVNPTLAQWKSAVVQSDGIRWLKIAGVV